VRLDRQFWEQIFEHAREDYPAECCGIVTEDGNGRVHVHRCDNIQDRLHNSDPEAHSRTSKTAYRMDDMQVTRILTETETSGGRLMAFYHSHIDCDAYFSEEDRNAAMFLGEPTYPGVAYLVVSVANRKVCGRKGFRWDEEGRAFVETPLEIGS
jgi:proteasome lid subunit RPN8/RPN11